MLVFYEAVCLCVDLLVDYFDRKLPAIMLWHMFKLADNTMSATVLT